MKIFKKILFPFFISLIFIGGLFFVFQKTSASTNETLNIYFFWGDGCPHCAKEEIFLQNLKQKYENIKINDYEVWYNQQNRNLLMTIGKKLNADINGVPFTVIGGSAVSGYYNDETTGAQIENYVKECLKNKCEDPVAEIVGLNINETPKTTSQLSPLISPTPTPTPVLKEEITIKAYLFFSKGCPLCNAEKNYLESIKEKYPNLEIQLLEISKKENLEIFKKTAEELNLENPSIPLLVIGKNYILGWKDEQTTGQLIENDIQCAIDTGCPDIVGNLISSINLKTDSSLPEKIDIPLIGEIETKNLSLPILTIILGGIDGFNPCAMWVLVFLISFLLGMKDRKRMWIFGLTFLIISGIIYFLFMAAWLKLILFIGAIFWIRLFVSLIAIGGGAYNLKEFFTEKDDATCKVTDEKKKKKIVQKMKEIVKKDSFWLVLGGIIVLAASVNLIELVCSAGLPVVFTQVLAMSNLSQWQYLLYMLLYIFIYMLDDIIVFGAAMLALKVTAKTNKYTHYSHLIGGILMIIIGLLLIFKPAWLMFG